MRTQLQYLTGLRGVAVLLVLCAHLFPGHCFDKPIAYLGMSLFFTLSGVVLTYVWANKFLSIKSDFINLATTFCSFIWARFARLAPLYLLVALPYFASSGRSWEEMSAFIPRYLLGMQSWFYEAKGGGIVQLFTYAFSWSISSEIWLYLLFPLALLLLFPMAKYKRLLFVFAALFLYACVLTILVVKGIYTGSGYPPSQTKMDWFVYLSPYGRIIEFVTGMLAGFILIENNQYNKKKSFHGLIAISILALIIFYVATSETYFDRHPLLALLRMSPLFTLPVCYLMMALARGNDISEKIFSNILLTSIGEWSYSIYLLGGVAIPLAGGFWTSNTVGFVIKYTTHFAIVILISAGSYRLIEVPARRFLLRINPLKLSSRKDSIVSSAA